MNQRKRVAVVMKTFEGLYHEMIFNGLKASARNLDCDLLFFPGMEVDVSPYRYFRESGSIYHLPNERNIDGIVVIGTSLFASSGEPSRDRFLNRFEGIPLVYIGEASPSVPTISINPRQGIQAAVDHLVNLHGYRRFSLIAGPEGGPESRLRTSLYTEELGHRGIRIDPRHIEHGDFNEETGREALNTLFTRNCLDIDALIAENDEMALGAIDQLEVLGYKVPDDIAVIGFDGIPHLESLTPALTTIIQPVYHQASMALELLCRRISGENVGNIELPTRFRARTSCGCMNQDLGSVLPADVSTRLEGHLLGAEGRLKDHEELNSFLDTIQFLDELEDCRDFIVRRMADAHNGDDAGAIRYGEVLDLIYRRMLAQEEQRLWILMSFRWRNWMVSRGGLVNASKLEDILDQMESRCWDMRFGLVRIVMVPDRNRMDSGRIIFSFPKAVPTDGLPIEDFGQTLPQTSEEPRCYLVNALYHQTQLYGYMLVEVKEHFLTYYEDLRAEISNSLHTVKLIQELQATQSELSMAERQAAVGSLIRGIAHEISGPVGTALTATSHILHLAEERVQDDVRTAATTATTSLENAGIVIKKLKELQSDLLEMSGKPFSPEEWIESTVNSLPDASKSLCRVSVDVQSGPIENGSPQLIRRIINELMENSLCHGRRGDQRIRISIRVESRETDLFLSYEDDGIGVEPHLANRMLDPFYTTGRRTGHQGLGLPALYEMVVTQCSGSFMIRHPDEGGLGFEISLPWRQTIAS